MIFITVTDTRGREITIRGDHILQMNDFSKDEQTGTWCLVLHTGWMPYLHTQAEIMEKIDAAKQGRTPDV